MAANSARDKIWTAMYLNITALLHNHRHFAKANQCLARFPVDEIERRGGAQDESNGGEQTDVRINTSADGHGRVGSNLHENSARGCLASQRRQLTGPRLAPKKRARTWGT